MQKLNEDLERRKIPLDEKNKSFKKIQPLEANSQVMLVVDPFSTGAVLAAEFLSRGVPVVRVLSDDYPDHILNLVLEGTVVEFISTIKHEGNLPETLRQIKALDCFKNIIGCTPGCETGVELSDAISEELGFRTNGTKLSEQRRNKYLMGEQIRSCGLRAVRQAKAKTIDDIDIFLSKFDDTFKVVIKPIASAGTDGVYLCQSREEVYSHFKYLIGAQNVLGQTNQAVVIQEFLEGKEYVVDTVSRDGVHKCVCLWEYEKKPCNDAAFVYYNLRLRSGDSPRMRAIIEYDKKVLDALDIRNGPAHGEIMDTSTGPCLVEVAARPHGAEGSWVPLVSRCFGMNQVKTVADLYLDPEAFEKTPNIPIMTKLFGIEVDFVSKKSGKLTAMPRLDEVKKLPSFFEMDLFVKPGEKISKTIDCITMPGSVRLLHSDPMQLEIDANRIRQLEDEHDFYVVDLDERASMSKAQSISTKSS